MLLADLLGAVDVLEPVGDSPAAVSEIDVSEIDVSEIVQDSRRVTEGALFCAIRGASADGHDHAAAAVRAGAAALLVERSLPLPVPQVRVADVRAAVGRLAARFHDDPSRSMRVLGVTGTNGKTTTTYLLEAIARAARERTGVIGTTGARVDGEPVPVGFTTPEATELQALLARMRDAGVRTVAMEVSSHALVQRRVDGTQFRAVCFTNLSQDHLDYHGSLDRYFEAKARLFGPELAAAGVVNVDDPYGRALAERARIPTRTYSLSAPADVGARAVHTDRDGATFVLHAVELDVDVPVRLRLLGRFNVANALGAAATALVAGFSPDQVVAGLEAPIVVPGRMERVDCGQPFAVFVDYAHTPDALDTVLCAVRNLVPHGRVIALFGCGGDRDPSKRAEMGRVVGRQADAVVLTSDNPRSEDPADIASQAEVGLRETAAEHHVELDRRVAIRRAFATAREGDVVLLLGKGAEPGQTTGGVTVPFDDRVVAREELEALAWT